MCDITFYLFLEISAMAVPPRRSWQTPSKPMYSAVPPDTPQKQVDPVLLRIEKQGRGGKTVTVLSRLQMHPAGKEELLGKLKRACGAGGALKDGELEIQGDQRNKLKPFLEGLGYRVKGA
jgi:translation initiation factor 1